MDKFYLEVDILKKLEDFLTKNLESRSPDSFLAALDILVHKYSALNRVYGDTVHELAHTYDEDEIEYTLDFMLYDVQKRIAKLENINSRIEERKRLISSMEKRLDDTPFGPEYQEYESLVIVYQYDLLDLEDAAYFISHNPFYMS
jgi:hypothetical protein